MDMHITDHDTLRPAAPSHHVARLPGEVGPSREDPPTPETDAGAEARPPVPGTRRSGRGLLLAGVSLAALAGGFAFLVSPLNRVYPVPALASEVRARMDRLAEATGVRAVPMVAPSATLAEVEPREEAAEPVVRPRHVARPRAEQLQEVVMLGAAPAPPSAVAAGDTSRPRTAPALPWGAAPVVPTAEPGAPVAAQTVAPATGAAVSPPPHAPAVSPAVAPSPAGPAPASSEPGVAVPTGTLPGITPASTAAAPAATDVAPAPSRTAPAVVSEPGSLITVAPSSPGAQPAPDLPFAVAAVPPPAPLAQPIPPAAAPAAVAAVATPRPASPPPAAAPAPVAPRDPVAVAANLRPAPMSTAEQIQVLEVVTGIARQIQESRQQAAQATADVAQISAQVRAEVEDLKRRVALAEARAAVAAAGAAGVVPPPAPAAPAAAEARAAEPSPAERTGGPARLVRVAAAPRSAAAARVAPPPGTEATPAPAGGAATRYRVQAASPGLAMLAEVDRGGGDGAQIQVVVGDSIPGWGRVRAIGQRGTAWVVTTERGTIQ